MEAATELEAIKWILVAILIGIVLIAAAAIFIAVIFYLGYGVIREQSSGRIFRALAEDCLAKSDNQTLLELIEERLDSHPQDAWAHWYLGQAKFHSGALAESKRSFERVRELEPGWHNPVESWLDKLTAELGKGPQLVE